MYYNDKEQKYKTTKVNRVGGYCCILNLKYKCIQKVKRLYISIPQTNVNHTICTNINTINKAVKY
ncbi:hypothetical protein M2138_000013 [Dysgonomonadaceae bacterium PH5-43]|nr:hypothetical protein [Dysgonomonadaceae bacterium PH5-43]